jgi:ABC-2 type transport system permease protein
VIALVTRSCGRLANPFCGVLIVLSGFQIALIAVASEFAGAGNFERIAQLVPSVLAPALAPALTSFDRMATLGFFDPLVVMLVVQWAIYVGTEPAGEVETGLVDLVLARSVPRHRVMTRTLIVTLGSTLLLTLAMLAGTLIGLQVLAPTELDWPTPRVLLLMVAHLALVGWCFGAAAMAVAGWARRRGSAIAVTAIAAVALYLVDFLGLWWPPVETLARVTPFAYFHGGPLLAGTADPFRNLVVLGSITIAAAVTAYVRFQRRDL